MLASPRVQQNEDAYALMLLESQIRSEKRMADAALATAAAVKAQREATRKRWEDEAMTKLSESGGGGGGSLSARF